MSLIIRLIKKWQLGLFLLILLLLVQVPISAEDAGIDQSLLTQYINALPTVMTDGSKDTVPLNSPYLARQHDKLEAVVKKNGFHSLAAYMKTHEQVMKAVVFWKLTAAIQNLKLTNQPEILIQALENQIGDLQQGLTPHLLNAIKPHADSIAKIVANPRAADKSLKRMSRAE